METRAQLARPAAQPAPGVSPAPGRLLQRKCDCGARAGASGECEECRKKKLLQRRAVGPGASSVPPVVYEVLRSSGQPLDAETRALMEPHFGRDFSQVRVHTGARAMQSAHSLNAVAYTVGSDIVFAAGQVAPHLRLGNELLAHELTHVIQQGGAAGAAEDLAIGPPDDSFEREADAVAASLTNGGNAAVSLHAPPSPGLIQRDLATPLPARPSPAQPDLTAAQIQEAINFNRARYDAANTRLIQNLLGGPVTGTWTAENIEAIAATQEQYGLHKDGKVGDATFRFLDREQRLEGMSTKTEDCLVSFTVIGPDAQNLGRDDATHCHFGGHFRVEAEFSPRCNCAGFQYRQFIRGHWHRTRGGVVTDLPIREPGGVLPAGFIEDTDTSDPVPHYGHRDMAAGALVEDHYIDAANADDQAHGCRYRCEDFPGFNPLGDCLAGDRYDLFTTFRGEIQRNGTAIQQKFWTAINAPNWRP